MAKYVSGRQKNLKVGIASYSENLTSLEVIGNVGIATTNATSKLYVVGDGYFTGVVTALGFYVGGDLVSGGSSFSQLYVSGISTLGVTSATNLTSQQLNVSGITTLGVVTSGNIYSTGVITATTFSGNASSATYATSAGIATYATVAGISTYSTNAGIATYATSAGIATYAISSGIATYATNAGIATYATSAGIATYATVAGIATYSTNAGIATYATVAGIATYATSAGIATYASNAGIATYATVAGIATYSTNAGIATYATVAGIATYSTNAGIATYSTNAGIATALQNSRTFEITGDIVASPISFNGTGNVSLAATIQPNSVALGGDTTGDYVQTISGTANQITVTSGTGEGSTPTLSIPNQFTPPQDVTVTRDLQVNRNLNVTGNITIGGTSATIFSQTLNIFDPDIVLGYRTDAFGNDISNDNTANHGGVALASTEGNPLVQLFIAGIETNPATYKKIMWFKAGTFVGLGTDAWLSNYAVGIGSTQFPSGTRLAAGSVQFTQNDLSVVRNINASGIITGTLANTLTLNTSGTGLSGSATYNNSGATTFTVTSNATSNNTPSTIVARDASGNFSAGTITANLTGTASTASFATTAYNLSDAANITTGTINSARLSGTYNINISGNAATASYATNSGIATYATTAGIATYATTAGVATALQNARTFEITGDIIASPISFNGTGNVSLAATIQPNSVALGGDTTGNYVASVTNGSYIIGGDGGSEGAALTIGVAATSANTASQVVARDASGNFSAGTITANLTGNASSATYATNAGIATYATNAGVSTSVIGGIASVSQLNVSGITTVGFITATNLYVAGVGTFLSSGLKIRNPANTFGYTITGDAIAADRVLTLPPVTTNTGVAVTGYPQTFTATQTFDSNLIANGTLTLFGSSTGNQQVATAQTTGTLTFGGTGGTGLITFGRATTSQQTDIQAGASGVGTTKTINFGTGGLSGSFTQINIGPTAGVGTITINSGTNLGINSTRPTSKLDVVGDAKFTGVVTATAFSGNASSATYASNAGIATYATSAGIATYATSSGIATYATSSGIATYATSSGIATYATNAGIATNVKGGSGGTLIYQSATDTTAFISNGTSGQILQSNGGTSAPTWVPAAPSNAITGLTVRDEGTVVGGANSVSTINFVGAIVSVASTAGIATITFLDYVSNAGVATYATNAGISTNLKGGLVGNIPYQSAADTTVFLTNGSSGTILQSNGVGNTPSWVTPAPAGAITGLTVRDEGTIVGSASSVSTLNFVGAIVSAASTAGIATITFLDYVSNAGTSTSVSGGTASVTQLNVSGITTTNNLNVTGVGTFLSSGLKIRNPANTFGYTITGGAIAADRILNLPVITATDTVAVLGLSQTFTASQTFSGIDVSSGSLSYTGSGSINLGGTSLGAGTVQIGGISQTGTITLGQATVSQTTNIQAGASGVGTTKTINFGTGGLSGSFTQINIGPTAGVGTITINSGTNLGINSTRPTSKLDVVGDVKVIGVVTATSFSGNASSATYATNAGIATYATTAGVATALQNSRTFEITGDIVASPISFNGTGNVSLAATIQPNSVALGSDTTGDYVQSITGTSNQITVTSGTGEGSTPTLSIPNQFTAPQDVTVTRDLQVNRNLNVTGNITIGGTTATIFSQSLNIFDPDIVLGYRTDAFGNDVSNDNTANHGGVALASTEGNPLVQLFIAGIETNPATYKKIMWFKSGTFSGLGTDAWLSNYAVGIGSTQFPTGTRLAAGSVQFTQNDLAVVRNINASGVITATTFSGTLSGYASTAGIATYASNAGIATYATSSGISTYATSAGIATYSTNADIATYATSAGIATYATTAGIATYSTSAGIATYATSAGIATYATSSGIATYATSAGVSTSVIGGIGSITQLQVTGVSTFTNGPVLVGSATSTGTASQRLQVTGGAYVSGSVGIGTTYSTYELDVIGRVRATNDIDLVSTTGALNLTGRPNLTVGSNNPIVNISHPTGGYLYSLYGWQDTGNDRVYQQLANSTDYFTALDSDSEFIIGLKGAGLLGGSTYSFKIDIDAETSLYYNQTEKLTTTNQGILVTGLTSTTTLNVGTGGTVITTTASGLVGIGTTNPTSKLDVRGAINVGDAVSITAERDSGNNDVIYFNPLNESRVSIGINTTLNWSSLSNIPDVAFVADNSIFGSPKIAIANPTGTDPHYQLYAAYSTGSVPYGYVRQELNNASYAIALDNAATAFSVGDRTSLDSTRASNFSAANEAFVVILNGSTSLFHSKSKKFETSGVGVTVYGNLNVGTGGTVITTTATGLVGIGTTNPGATLNVVPTATSIAGLFSGTTSSDMVRITQLGTGNALVVEDSANPDSSPFVVTGIGSVGIGTASPAFTADIAGDARITSTNKMRFGGTAGTTNFYIQYNSTANSLDFVAG